MASSLDMKSPYYWAALVCSALLYWFGTGLTPLWPLTWLAPLPVLLIAVRCNATPAAFAACAAVLLGSLNLWHYLHELIGVPGPVVLIRGAVSGLVMAGAILMYRRLMRRGAAGSAILAFASLCVTYEYLVSLTSSVGTALSLAYSQLDFLPFLQLASVTGPWGMSFLLYALPAAAVCAADRYAHNKQQSLQVLAAAGSVAIVLLAFGFVRLNTSLPNATIKVGLLASDAPGNDDVARAGDATQTLLQAYATQTASLTAAGAKVIVLPEKLGVVADDDRRSSDQPLREIADHTGVPIVAGLVIAQKAVDAESRSGLQFNAARIYSAHAATPDYHKEHMLPPFESHFTPGTALTTFTAAWGKWGVAICKDMDFTDVARRYGREEVGLLLVPGWDFNVDWSFHGHIAIMRAVENGFNLVRAAKNGSLYAADNRGRVLAELRTDQSPFTTLIADVPVTHSTTLYQQFGDWFAWLVLIILSGSIVQCWRVR